MWFLANGLWNLLKWGTIAFIALMVVAAIIGFSGVKS